MKEYISREALIEELKRRDFYPAIVRRAIEAIPAADVRQVVRGEWRKSELFNDHPECPVCSYVSRERSNYCPNCGAVMDGGSNNA